LSEEGSFVAGDWGTSHLRLFLCDAQGKVLDSATGPGIGASDGRCAEIFDSLASKWGTQLPAVLCGMVGSNIGWIQAPYAACPATLAEIAGRSASVRDGRIRIVPGLSCRNHFAAPDFMRGEETQILGALALEPALRQGRQLLCLPGTHTKWAVLNDGVVSEFLTAPTGELFNLLSSHSVLVRERGEVTVDAFRKGLAQFARFPAAQLLHRLFECRSRSLAGELVPLHGDMPQGRRDGVMLRFRSGRAKLLVATNVAARGLDISHVSHVFSYDVPDDPEEYTHRIGRTGRVDRTGIAFTFVSHRDLGRIDEIEKATGAVIERLSLADIGKQPLAPNPVSAVPAPAAAEAPAPSVPAAAERAVPAPVSNGATATNGNAEPRAATRLFVGAGRRHGASREDVAGLVNATGVEPLSHPIAVIRELALRLREDKATETDHRDEYQKCAPATQDGLYLVPKVIE